MQFFTNQASIQNDLEDIIRLFDPDYSLGFLSNNLEDKIQHFSTVENCKIQIKICINDCTVLSREVDDFSAQNKLVYNRIFKRLQKNALYEALNGYYKRQMPWGSLTGIRPTKPFTELLNEQKSPDIAAQKMREIYFLSAKKSRLVCDVVLNQRGFFPPTEKYINLYIHIPFCASKCAYCSFPSIVSSNAQKHFDCYVDALILELQYAYELFESLGAKVYTTYIGGGTPTVLTAYQLERLFGAIKCFGSEFTLEAGRADSITEDKLAAAKKGGVNRLCINPQTFHDKTLQLLARGHSVSQFYDAYESAQKFGFDLNCDLIAGLMGESESDFLYSVSQAVGLSPQNITIHTICLKSGARLKENKQYPQSAQIEQMLDNAYDILYNNGYIPYYLYRQKYMAGNFENTGWTKPNKQCLNNISVMEEMLPVYGCGAGAISKVVFSDSNRIERLANSKDLTLYLERLHIQNDKKKILFQNSLL